jgi:hypothetical protein
MVPNVTPILQRFTTEWAALLQPEAILAACGEVGHRAWRNRVLTPVTTIQLFPLQILHGNTAYRHLPHVSGLRSSAAAYWLARATQRLTSCHSAKSHKSSTSVDTIRGHTRRWMEYGKIMTSVMGRQAIGCLSVRSRSWEGTPCRMEPSSRHRR